jgi:hypothetical protein
MSSDGIVRTILLIDIVAMALLALFYLRERRMSWAQYCVWGAVIIFVPVLGPFLAISKRPGEKHPDPFPSGKLREQIYSILQRLLPKKSALDFDSPPPVRRRHPKRRF